MTLKAFKGKVKIHTVVSLGGVSNTQKSSSIHFFYILQLYVNIVLEINMKQASYILVN